MFNFFDEIIKQTHFKPDKLKDYQMITISGRLLYVEGHQGLIVLSKENMIFKVKNGKKISVQGKNLDLAQLTDCTLVICGEIEKIEVLP